MELEPVTSRLGRGKPHQGKRNKCVKRAYLSGPHAASYPFAGRRKRLAVAALLLHAHVDQRYGTHLLEPPLSERLLLSALAISNEAGDDDVGLLRGSSPSRPRLDRDEACEGGKAVSPTPSQEDRRCSGYRGNP